MAYESGSTATALLREEHELILRVAGALNVMVNADPGHEPLDYDTVERCVTFFRLYSDACHHGKEEDILFPTLGAHGLPTEDGPIAVMLFEHDEGRVLVQDMAASLDGAREGHEGADQSLRAAALGFVTLITDHIAKENRILFEMADPMIEGVALGELLGAYEEVCERRFEGYSKFDLEELARRILD